MRSGIGGHDKYHMTAVRFSSFVIRQYGIVHNLQQNIEHYGEDPVLTGKMAGAYIEGMQGDDPKYLRCASTLKHFYGNNTEVGRGWKNSSIDPRNKYELYLEPFRRCIEESGAEGIMTAYNRINGTVGGMVRENMEISESVIMTQADQKMYENKKSSR